MTMRKLFLEKAQYQASTHRMLEASFQNLHTRVAHFLSRAHPHVSVRHVQYDLCAKNMLRQANVEREFSPPRSGPVEQKCPSPMTIQALVDGSRKCLSFQGISQS